ncbi:gephyrin-like molybdotransferase Glp [uncultured Sneathiella sp.]|uniref:molybdopterin molybdotransferase MoeA n=1 Tax=uncultured Sneathiella sp. TaxID=879315 RepID=UPI0030EE05DB|tara:strand:+ start:16325 stop:17581 length:1257 start_codon:yes stop_codon:yes gene_type:complete
MERLANDCFANVSEMISANKALEKIASAASLLVGVEICALREAKDRYLAEDIVAPQNVPLSDNSAVDGFAFEYSSYRNADETPRAVAGQSTAGHPMTETPPPGSAVKILTGALMPDGFDTVVMVEDVSFEGDKVIFPAHLKSGANRRKAGEDIREGQVLLKRGTRLRAQELGYLASVGIDTVRVFNHLRVAVFSTGDELISPGETTFIGSMYDSNRIILTTLLESYGCQVTDLGILKDKRQTVRDALKRASEAHDLVITSGGVSMGEEDHVRIALSEIGQLHFWRIAIKPGRPLALGQIGNTAFVGLPGNPIAALVCALKFVRPLVGILSGWRSEPPLTFQAKAGFTMKKKPGRTEWLRGRYTPAADGIGTAEKYHTEGSGILSSAVWANGLIEIGDDVTYIEEGDMVTFLSFSELMR